LFTFACAEHIPPGPLIPGIYLPQQGVCFSSALTEREALCA
jgi:hypothetical protein